MPGGGGHSLIWPIQVWAAEQGLVFEVLSLKQGIQFKRLEQCVFLDWKPFKESEDFNEPSTFAIPIISFVNVYFHDLSVENYLILYAKRNKSGSESSVSCLKQGSVMSNFCLRQGQGWSPQRHSSTQNSLECPPGIKCKFLIPNECPSL